MENLLQGIVLGHKETQKKLDEQTDVLNKILDVEKGVAKAEAKRDKREAQVSKRKKSDDAKGLLGSLTKAAKKDKKGGFLSGLLSGGMSAIAKILGGSKLLIAGLAAVVGGAIALYVNNKQFKDIVDKVWKVTKDNILTPAWTWIKEKGPEAYKWLEKNILIPMIDFLRKGLPQLLKPVTGNDQANDIGDVVPSLVEDGIAAVLGAERGKARKQLTTKKNNLFRNLQRSEEYGGFKEGAEREQGQEDFDESQRLLKMFEQKENMQVQLERIKSQLGKTDDEIGFLNHFGNPKGYRERLEDERKLIDQNLNDKVIQLKREKQALKDLGINVASEEFERKQTGGFVGTVPGQGGNGDRFRTSVAPGSVVLNQTAAGHFQDGGHVPVMLEQGEKVFGPRDPAAGAALAMNSMIGRFQNGGIVEASHPDTGSGWSVGKDYKGRPSIFNKEAAEAFSTMMKASKGLIQTADIQSSRRSQEYNAGLKGASPTSNHLTGNAVDIHGASKVWMKENGEAYGFKNLVYSQHDGHFDYTKGGAKRQPGDGDEITARNLMGGFGGELGQLISGLAGAFQTVFGDLFGGLFGDMFGGLTSGISDLFGGTNPGGVKSEPLTGDAASSAKKMHDYVIELGYSAAQAKGIVANIERESGFDPKIKSGDDGGPGGLFQWKGSRQTPQVASLVNSGNWKGQIKYALENDVGPKYKSETAGMNALDASMWWAEYWERPASLSNARDKHSKSIPSYGFQNGGVANVRGTGTHSSAMVAKSQEQFAQKIAEAVGGPIIVPVPTGGGGGGGGTVVQPGNDTNMPSLPSSDSSIMAMEYKYRITMGASI